MPRKAPSQTDPNTLPEFTTRQVQWLQDTFKPRLPAVPPPEVGAPCDRMALFAAVELGKNIVVQTVVNAYEAQVQREKGTPPPRARRRRR